MTSWNPSKCSLDHFCLLVSYKVILVPHLSLCGTSLFYSTEFVTHQHNSTADIFVWDSQPSQTAVSLVSQRILMGFQLYNGFSSTLRQSGKKLWMTVWISKCTGLEERHLTLPPPFTTFIDTHHLKAPESYFSRKIQKIGGAKPHCHEAIYPYNLKQEFKEE